MNYSRQRELIHRIVLENPIHPTADEVYACLLYTSRLRAFGTRAAPRARIDHGQFHIAQRGGTGNQVEGLKYKPNL